MSNNDGTVTPVMAELERKLKILTSKKQTLYQRVQEAYNLSKDLVDPKVLNQFKIRAASVAPIRPEFVELLDRINELKLEINPDGKAEFQTLNAFDDLYYSVLEKQASLVESSSSTSVCNKTSPVSSVGDFSSNLPKISLKVFKGDLIQWTPFINLFSSLVDSNKNLASVQKFLYLQSCLEGEPLSLIKHLPLTESNYQVALTLLKGRYQSIRHLAAVHVENILNVQPMKYDTHNILRSFYETLSENYSALEALSIPNLADFLLFQLTYRNLHNNIRRAFEEDFRRNTLTSSCETQDIPSFKTLLEFLSSQCKILEAASFTSRPQPGYERSHTISKTVPGPRQSKGVFMTTSSFSRGINKPNISYRSHKNQFNSSAHRSLHLCPICKSNHSIYNCPSLINSSLEKRKQLVLSANRCSNCLGFHSESCRSTSKCCRCGSPQHHTLLCDQDSSVSTNPCMKFDRSNDNPLPQINSFHSQQELSTVLLGTAIVQIQDRDGNFIDCRMLLDSGAQASFLTRSFFSKLKIPIQPCDVSVSGLCQNSVYSTCGRSAILLKPRISSGPILSTDVIIMEKLTNKLPSQTLSPSIRNLARDMLLADPTFDNPSPVDGIIGADLIPYIYNGPSHSFGVNLPSAMSSIFGWVLIGRVPSDFQISGFVSEVSLDQNLKRFWEIENTPSSVVCDPEDALSEEIYRSRVRRTKQGIYVVPLLLKPDCSELGESYSYAKRCLINLERRLHCQPQLKEAYHSFMKDYVDLGHMRKLEDPSIVSHFFIPHHPVVNLSSSTTKLRVVFNGSAKSTSGKSLNDVLFTGPKLQSDLNLIIFNFRLHRIAFTADIAKMFRQFLILPEETSYQHILWRFSQDEPITIYKLLTVTYGLRSAPYLSNRSLRQLVLDEGSSCSRVCEIINEDTYIDDVISGADTVDEALLIQNSIVDLFSRAGLHLRKWSSNNPHLLSNLPPEDCEMPLDFGSDSCSIKVLGLQWLPTDDVFSYKITPIRPQQLTKRSILSDISRLFDPLGWLSPVTFFAKHFIQRLWTRGLSWDEILPSDLISDWTQFVEELNYLSSIRIPRFVLPSNPSEIILVGFSDASEKGYGAVVYLVVFSNSSVNSFLLMAKSRVAPLKSLSIPRLELCGALILSRLLKFVLPSLLSRNLKEVICFSDSSTVLAWVRTPPHKLKSFVANRVVEITEVTSPSQWYYVKSGENPADYLSRGLFPSMIQDNDLWFYGPSWLRDSRKNWPLDSTKFTCGEEEFRCLTSTYLAETSSQEELEYITRFSQLNRLQRVTSWIFRFVFNSRNTRVRRNGPLTPVELAQSLTRLIKLDQTKTFSDDITKIQKGKECSKRLRTLRPFLDDFGLLRVGGRLNNSELEDSARNPLLLAKRSHISKLLIDSYHRRYMHVGPRCLHSLLQRQFWILSARQVIRSRLSKCLSCLRMRTSHLQPLMSDLPLSRVQPSRPFTVTGTDFGGPFLIKESYRRKARVSKAYLCLFICFSTKAVHLEVVSDLSTDAFIASLERFVSRRGLCSVIHSDCGTNYVGANRYLTDVHRLLSSSANNDKIFDWLAQRQISWKHNIPTACHWGGIWEAGIKSAKHLLKRVIGQQVLTFEDLSTVFTRVEAVLNSRPLCPLSTDPRELNTLTPAHFLIGGPLVSLPEPPLENLPLNRLSRWKILRQISQHFWNRWHSEYLNTLTQRHKWNVTQPNLKVGDLVLLREGHCPPLSWRVGQITQVYPGQDGVVRAVSVRTAKGEFKRPVVKLAPLPGP